MADLNVSNVGKNQVHLSSLKAGLKEEDLKTDKEKSIFKSIDKDGNGVLDADELKQFAASMDKSNDDIATKKEAKAYIKENDLKGVKKKDVLKFLKNNNINTDDVKNTQVIEQDGQKLVQVEYNDGRKETIKPDKSTDVTQTDANGNTVTESRDKDKNLTQKTTVATNGDKTTVEYETTVDANSKPVPKKETSVTDNGNKTTETNYVAGKKVDTTETVKSEGSKTVTQYDKNEAPFTATKTQGLNESQYIYVNGDPRETSRVENKGRDDQRTTKFTYDDENGTVTSVATEASVSGQKTTTTVKKDGEKLSETIVDGNKTTTTTKNAKGDGFTQVIQDGDKSTTTNQLNNEGHRLTSTKVVDGKEYTLNYDGQGNTTGIIVQNGESPASIAKKFGCTEAQLKEANQDVLGGKKYFDVGSEIKVPRELEADDKALQGRKSSQEAKAEFARDEQIRAQKRAEAKARQARIAAENKAYKELGLKNRVGVGKPITDEKGNKYTIVGQAGYGRTIAKDKKGDIHVISHDKKDLKTQYVKVDVANVKAGKKRVVINNRAYYTDGAVRDKHGRMTVTDWTGKEATLSGGKSKTDLSDRKILKGGYVEASDAMDAGKGKVTYLENGIKYVQSSDGTYWYFNEKGQALNANQVEKQIAQKVTQDLDKAADGWGTDEELMSKANAGISSPGVLSQVNKHYQAQGYKADGEYKTAYEQFQGSELQRSEVYVNNAQLVKNNVIQDQGRRDEIIQTNILEYGKTKENLQSGLDAIGNRTDFENANIAAAKYNQEHGNKAQFKNQYAINTLIYHQSEGDADSIHAANNKLIDPQENFLTSEEITRTKAEEGVYYLQEAKEHTMAKGLADQAKNAAIDSNDAEVYAQMDELLKEKGEPSLKDTVEHTRLAKVGYGDFGADERAQMALDELKFSLRSANAAASTPTGSMTMGTAFSNAATQLSDAKNAAFSMDNLYKVLNSPEAYSKFKTMVAQDPKLKAYLTEKGFDEKKLVFETKTSNLSDEEISANKAQYANIKNALEQSKHEFQNVTGKEGSYDSFINKFRDTYGLGITRESIAKLGENSSYMLHNLELAAEGKLTDSKGNPISFEDYAKELNITTEKMNETTIQYQQHQAYGKMAVDAVIAVATIPVGGGAVKVLSTVANGVKTYKVVRALDAAGKTVKEIGVVKDLAAAQKLAATTAKAVMAESKVGQATLKVGQHLVNPTNIAKSTVMGATNGTVMFAKERLNTMTSAEGDSMQARSQAEKNLVSNTAAATVGYHVGGAAANLDKFGTVGRLAGTGLEVTSDAATSAAVNYAQTGEASVSAEDMVTSAIFNAAGHAKMGKGHVDAPKADVPKVEPQGVMHATGNATHHSGGKLNAEKMENARNEVRDIAKNGTPKEVAKAHQAADYQQVQSRPQGRELKQNIEDASGFVSVGKERIALDSSSLDDLAKAKKSVEGWTIGTRDKEAILAKIDQRMNEIKAGQVKPTEPARASEIVDEINTNVNKTSEHIMEGKTGAIGSHDVAILRDNLVNNVKTEEDVEKFISDIKNRVGVDDKGNMHVYQVQGKDHAADLVNQAEAKLKFIRANKADMQQITTTLDDAISANKGLSEDGLQSIRAFSQKSNSVEDLQTIIDKMKNGSIKKSSAQKKLIRDMQDKVDILKAKQNAANVATVEPKKTQVADDGKTADFTAEQQRIYKEEMQIANEAAPAPAQKPQEKAVPKSVEVKPENNKVQNNENKTKNTNEVSQKPVAENSKPKDEIADAFYNRKPVDSNANAQNSAKNEAKVEDKKGQSFVDKLKQKYNDFRAKNSSNITSKVEVENLFDDSVNMGELENNAKASQGLSDEIKDTFGHKTQQDLSNLQNGQVATLNKGDWHYVVKNNNGQIVVVKKDGNVNFDIPMSNRTPVGKARGGKMSEVLSPESKAVYRDSYAAYLNTKDMKITHKATNMITQDNLLHGTGVDSLLGKNGILEKGLVPREISGKTAAHLDDGSVPMTLTPLCTDVWDVRQSSSIKDYFDANNSHWANNRGESFFLSNTSRVASPITIVLDKKSMHHDLLDNSFNVNQTGRSPLIRDGGIGGIGDGAHDYPTHRAIPIGAPANAIDRIIVDTRAVSASDIKAIRNKINKNGLDIDIYDINGNLLSQSKKKTNVENTFDSSIENSNFYAKEEDFEIWHDSAVPLDKITLKPTTARPMTRYILTDKKGRTFEVFAPKGASAAELAAAYKKKRSNMTIDARSFTNPQMQKLVGATPQGEVRSRLLDLDSSISTLPEGKIKAYVDKRLAEAKNLNDFVELETLMDAYHEAKGSYSHYQDYARYSNGNLATIKSDAAKMNAFIKNKEGESEVFRTLNNYADSDLTVQNRAKIFKGDNKESQYLYSMKKYIKNYRNSEMADQLYRGYLGAVSRKNPEWAKQLSDINEEYGVKVFLPTQYSAEKMNDTFKYITEELEQWKVASNGKAKMPPVMDFNTAKVDWYDTGAAYGQGKSSAYSEKSTGSLAFHDMNKQTVATSMRHEMTHTNDLTRSGYKIPDKYNLDEIMPKKTVIRNGKEIKVPDFENCKYVEEFKAAGIPEARIPYAYNTPAEFIARASEGDMSKYSPEFKQILIDFGMPEWMFDMK